MMNYTDRLAALMQDVVSRVPALSFIDMRDVLVFARAGRSNADGAFATCHCLTLPASEPGYYFWRDRTTHTLTRRSEWFVTKSPSVTIGARAMKYMISFALPRFCDQSLSRSRKEKLYPGQDSWVAKLDTVVHELYHIDPQLAGIRRIEKEDGTESANCHGHRFLDDVAGMVHTYLNSRPSPAMYDFLRDDFAALNARHGGITAASFRTFPSFPQRYIERLAVQPKYEHEAVGVKVEPLRAWRQPTHYTQDDLHLREFRKDRSHRLVVKPVRTGGLKLGADQAARAEVARRPVAGTEMLDAHDTRRARSVHELIAADGDRHVRGSRVGRGKEQDVAGREILRLD